MKPLASLIALCACLAPIPAVSAELFVFMAGGRSAITLDRDGARLPHVPGGWKFSASLGEHSHVMDEAGLERLRAAGYEVLENNKPPNRSVEDWVGMPRGSFRLTERAAAKIKFFHQQVVETTGQPQVLALQYGPISVKPKDSARWRDLGDRITLGSYPATDVPKAAVRRYDGVPLLFQMDPKTLPVPRPRVIDYDATGFVFSR